ncbi:50S ribosomal protein L34e [Candidatus Woesearchaeota archaeon]|nr:50S ribosomal protein L34e [Candidatus Woesearchaeota archaeon]
MTSPHKTKSRTFRRVHVMTPGGTKARVFKRRTPKAAHCPCGALLKGVPRALPSTLQNMPKTHKRPERPFGGVLCSACLRAKVKQEYV